MCVFVCVCVCVCVNGCMCVFVCVNLVSACIVRCVVTRVDDIALYCMIQHPTQTGEMK